MLICSDDRPKQSRVVVDLAAAVKLGSSWSLSLSLCLFLARSITTVPVRLTALAGERTPWSLYFCCVTIQPSQSTSQCKSSRL